MKSVRLSLVLAGTLAALVGCPAVVVAPPTPGSSKAPVVAPAGKSVLEGAVTAPAGLVAAGGGNLVAAGGGNLVAAGGGNLVAAGGGNFTGVQRGLLQAAAAPLAGAEVVATDGLGQPLTGVARVKTDKDGRYKLLGVPASGAFAVHVGFNTEDGKNSSTLVTLAEAGGTGDVSASTTCVAIGLLGERGKAIKGFDRASFGTAVGLIDTEIATNAPPPMWDRARIVSWMGKLEAKIDGLAASLNRTNVRLDSIEGKVDEVLGLLRGGSSAAPSSSPSGAPSATPSGTGSATPSATPTEDVPGGTVTPTPGTPVETSSLKPLLPTAGLRADAVRDNWGQDGLMTVDAATGVIWVASEGGVTRLNAQGIGELVVKISGNRLLPSALAADGAGNLWIADAYGGGAVRVTQAGEVGSTKAATGATATDVAVAKDGSVWLASADKRIVHFAPDGAKLGEVAPLAESVGAIAIDASGALWATYPTAGRVVKIGGDGKVALSVTLNFPSSKLVADGTGALWTWTPDGVARISADGKLLAIPSQSRMYAADDQGRLWTVDGAALNGYGSDGAGFASEALAGTPVAIAAAPGGKVKVLMDGVVTTYPK